MANLVDISMFNTESLKLVLLINLVNQSTMVKTQFITTHINPEQYKEALAAIKRGYIDRFNGRPIKGNLSGDTFETWGYNRDNGAGSAERIIENIKKALSL